ncbi:MAG TPA: hypothetical protein PK268_03875 [Enterococcus sp.]|nr:hypothetical protein [Enterococcus sp.]HPR81026.1 hypothetical protein [Enterococcus sp.]
MNEYIEIIHARENNLKNVSLKIPKNKITIFIGVSGSGKSSIVFNYVTVPIFNEICLFSKYMIIF